MRVFSNTAMSLDGKIGSVRHDHVRLGSDEDLRWMGEARAMADAVLVGGSTFRNWPLPLVEGPGQGAARAQPILNAVLTRRGLLVEPSAKLRSRWPDPRVRLLVLGPDTLDAAAHRAALGAEVETTATPTVEWALDRLAARGCASVLVEGGGDLIFQLLEADRLDEMFVTVCPWVLGGVGAPTPVDGRGFLGHEMRRLALRGARQVQEELYLHYEVLRPTAERGRVHPDAQER